MNKQTYRICIISEQLATGGAERWAANISFFFASKGIEVHHIITIDKIEYKYSGKILNLGKLKSDSHPLLDRIHRFYVLFSFFKNNKFDYIIDTRVKNRFLQEFIVTRFVFNVPYIVMIHSYMTYLYFPNNKVFANNMYADSYRIITVSKSIQEKVTKDLAYTNVTTIYNPVDFPLIEAQSNEMLSLGFKYIMAVGRMDDKIKQFDKLINSYHNSILPKLGVKLIILGEGKLKNELITQTQQLELEDLVIFTGKVSNPFKYYKHAMFTCLTSKHEGFPSVLIESLATGTPVVSFNCQSGPEEIILHGYNGLLVEDQNEDRFTLAMNEMVTNQELYLSCKQHAQLSVEKFSIENIGKQWLDLLNFSNQ